MKKSILFIISLLLLTTAGWSQKVETTTNSFALPNSNKVIFNLKFAQKISILPSNSTEVELVTKMKYSLPELAKIHQMETLREGGALQINTSYKMENLKNQEEYHCWSCESERMATGECFCLQVDYVIRLPKNATVYLETISGSIEMANVPNEVHLKTISGFLDVSFKPNQSASLDFKSVTGEIYTDLDVDLAANSTKYSKKVKMPFNGGGPKLKLETVSGDIYFRKM